MFKMTLLTTKVYSQNELTREKLLEETLMVRYLPFILESTDKLFMKQPRTLVTLVMR
jgi:hypothetical protein